MKHEAYCRLIARILIWQIIVAAAFGWNADVFSEGWSRWRFLSLGCQIIILACLWREIRGREEPVTRWVSFFAEEAGAVSFMMLNLAPGRLV